MNDYYTSVEERRPATRDEKDDWARSLEHLMLPYCANCSHWRVDVRTIEAEKLEETGFGEDTRFTEYYAKGRCVRFPPHPRDGQPTTEYMDECGEFTEGQYWTISLLRNDDKDNAK